MKIRFINRLTTIPFFVILFCLPLRLFAQGSLPLVMDGERVRVYIHIKGKHVEIVFTNRNEYYRDSAGAWSYWPYLGNDFIDAATSFVNDTPHVFMLHADGSFTDHNVVTGKDKDKTTINPSSFEAFEKITGDDMYVLSNMCLYVSRDHAGSWNKDTAGLNGVYLHDVAVDTSQNVYLATGKGIYTQPAKGGAWSSLSSPLPNPSYIFISSKNEFYISSSSNLYKSIDGTTWTLFNAGIKSNQYPVKFGQDSAGNVYVITSNTYGTSGNDLYKNDGTKWTSIGADIIKLNYDSSNTQIFNSINGGKSLYASTSFGLYRSDDLGATWTEDDKGITAENAAGMVVTSNGTKVISTSRGIYYESPGSTNWIHTFPVNNYMQGQRLFVDKNDVIYTMGELTSNSGFSSFTARVVYKSGDLGKTWVADTDGISKTNLYRYFVDENGIQYMGGQAGQVYVKNPGQSWKTDTAGLLKYNIGYVNAFGSDKKGTIYLSTSNSGGAINFKRPQSGGAWKADSTGAIYHQTVFVFYPDAGGNLYGGTYGGGLLKRTTNGWKKINTPIGYDVLAISSDKSGALFAAFSYTDASYNEIGYGVYFTLDSGNTWKNILNDNNTFIEFVQDADTVYGVSYYSGVYAFTEKTLGIASKVENKISGILYPNPGNGIFHLNTSAIEPGRMELEIYNTEGRNIYSSTFINSGREYLDIDLSSSKNGMYFYRLTGAKSKNSGKIIIRK